MSPRGDAEQRQQPSTPSTPTSGYRDPLGRDPLGRDPLGRDPLGRHHSPMKGGEPEQNVFPSNGRPKSPNVGATGKAGNGSKQKNN